MLELDSVTTFYGEAQALFGVSCTVKKGELVTIVGANGAGKSTLINTISGINRCAEGSITFEGQRIDHLAPHEIAGLGIVQVPEGRRLFSEMSVLENLEMGAYHPRARKHRHETMEYVFGLFPRLKERIKQSAGSFSGGEQQMLAIGRALMGLPRFLMFDEPSLGLAPKIVSQLFGLMQQIKEEKDITILLVEQNVVQSLSLADRGYVIENGKIVLEGTGEELLKSPEIRKSYLGV